MTPSGFVLLLHIILFDRSYNLTYWLNYGEVKAALRRRYTDPVNTGTSLFPHVPSEVSWRLLAHADKASSLFGSRSQADLSGLTHHTTWVGASPFYSGAGVKGQPTPSVLKGYDTSPKAHISSSLSPDSGAVALTSAHPWGAQRSAQLVEVMANYRCGGQAQATEPSSGPSQYRFGLPAEASALAKPRPLGSPLLPGTDVTMDWRALKLERELWRSADFLGQGLQTFLFRRRYYTDLLSPSTLVNKVSIWLPNHLIPGWAFVTPYSSRLRYTALGKVDIALIVVFLASLGSVFSSVNYVITYRYIGAPIFKGRRELRSFFIDALLVGSRMMILANPALLIGIILLLSDRHFGTSVFDFSGGGDTILFQHLF